MPEYQNPQSDPGAEKRLLLAFFFVFVVIAAMQYFLPRSQPPQPAGEPKPAQQQTAQAPQPSAPAAVPAGKKPAAAVPSVPVREAQQESESVLEDDVVRITFTNRGGQVKSWILKKYTDDNGKPLDLVNPRAAAAIGYPLSFFTYDKDLQSKLNSVLYVTGAAAAPPRSVSFEYSDGDTQARKTFSLEHGYVLTIETAVSNKGQAVQALPQWPGGLGDQSTLASYSSSRIDWDQNGSIQHKPAFSGNFITGKKWVAHGQTFPGPFEWAGTASQYFAAIFMPDAPELTSLVTLHNQIEVPRDPKDPKSEKDKASVLGVAVGQNPGVTRERLFAGPKAVDVLESVQAQTGGPDLRGAIDFGTFTFIVRPLFIWLKWTHEHMIANWGWAIALQTVIITLCLLPLRLSGMKSAMRMQKIQPQVKAINEKYKRYRLTDPRRADMQKELSELYKKESVNPLGGCLPMLLQLPFLYAFYAMLGNAIELRHASWLWIHDLSQPDPWHLLPIFVGATMFLAQKSTPQAGMDPVQQKMLSFMSPLMMLWFSWFLSAGLGVYWAISNVLLYVQQLALNRSSLGREVQKNLQRRTSRKR